MTTPPHPSPTLKLLTSIDEVPRERWDALVPPKGRPFSEWTFLHVLENSDSAIPDKGWIPRHLTLWVGDELVAAAPAYEKAHPWGEFVYNDFQWPRVAAHFGVRYFPKLILAIPFTPVTGPRVLTHPDYDRESLVRLVANTAFQVAAEMGCSSAHLQFGTDEETRLFEDEGFARAAGVQYHWHNEGEKDFDGFLGRFNSKRRHMLRAERRQLEKDGTTIRTLRGEELTPEVMRLAAACYADTVSKHDFGVHHLTDSFFEKIGEQLPHRAEVVVAEEAGRPIAAAFNFRGDKRLFGRQWGALEDRRYLHFNVCYYHSIERCLQDGLEAFEPGAGGEHKVPRGFDPTRVQSAHRFVHTGLHQALAHFLGRQTPAVEEWIRNAPRSGRVAGSRQENR